MSVLRDATQGRELSRRVRWVAAIAAVGAAALLTAPVTSAGDGDKTGKTVRYTLHVTAMVVDNLCNGDVVNLHGDLQVTETTTPGKNGSYTIRSSTNGRDLRGETVVATGLTPMAYRGQDREDSTQHIAPPPYPSTFDDTHWTALFPEGPAPTMYLVIVLRWTVAADGTAGPMINRMFLQCQKPHDD